MNRNSIDIRDKAFKKLRHLVNKWQHMKTLPPSLLTFEELVNLDVSHNSIVTVQNSVYNELIYHYMQSSVKDFYINNDHLVNLQVKTHEIATDNTDTHLPIIQTDFDFLTRLCMIDKYSLQWVSQHDSVDQCTSESYSTYSRAARCSHAQHKLKVNHKGFKFDYKILQSVNSIENISMANGRLLMIPISFFTNMYDLQNLDLHSNQLHNLSLWFPQTAQLQNLDVSDNKLMSMPLIMLKKSRQSPKSKSAGKKHDVYKDHISLNVSSNYLSALDPGAFCEYRHLKCLDVSYNWLTEFDSACGMHLGRLYLAGNSLQVLPRASFPDLKVLDISNNHINHNSLKWNNMHSLQNLRLDSNPLLELPKGSFQSLTDLQVLDLSNCSLVNVNDKSFKGLKNLTVLCLAITNWYN